MAAYILVIYTLYIYIYFIIKIIYIILIYNKYKLTQQTVKILFIVIYFLMLLYIYIYLYIRYGHSGINSIYQRLDQVLLDPSGVNGFTLKPSRNGHLLLRDSFFNPKYLNQVDSIKQIILG